MVKIKGKKWKKGQSCATNPEKRKFRDAANNKLLKGFASSSSEGPQLTAAALQKLDGTSSGFPAADDAQSMANTFATVATNYTSCTNMTFNKVQRFWPSNNAFHKEILAILAAVTEVIKSSGGTESETEYFGALMTTLESVTEEESVAATGYLINLVMKKVPAGLLKSNFEDVSSKLLSVLKKHVESHNTSLLKAYLSSLLTLLSHSQVWHRPVYEQVLSFALHSKPKVRKVVKEGVAELVKSTESVHPAGEPTATFCIGQIKKLASSDEGTVMQMVGLLKETMPSFSSQSIKESCNTILGLLPLGSAVLKTVCFEALMSLVASQVPDTRLSSRLNAQLIMALYDATPTENDTQLLPTWLMVMEKTHMNLRRIDPSACLSHLPRIIKTGMKCLDSTKSGVNATAGAITLKGLIEDLKGLPEDLMEFAANSPLTKVYHYVEAGLSYQYHTAWNYVLQLLALLMETFGKRLSHLTSKTLTTMADLYDSHAFSFKADLIYSLGKSVRHLGPGPVLAALPLQLSDVDETGLTRSWLLPILRENVRDCALGYFTTHLLPLATRLRTKAKQCGQDDKKAQQKTYEIMVSQIWDTLPGFCTNPTDLVQSFKDLARTLGIVIKGENESSLRQTVLSALRKLITTTSDREACRQELAKYGKNFMPILFNIFTSEPEEANAGDTRRFASLETVKVYLTILDGALVNTFFDECMKKMGDENKSEFVRTALMDLCIAMVQHVSSEQLARVFKVVTPALTSEDHTVQKKAYRILDEMCSSENPRVEEFIRAHLVKLQKILTGSLSKASASSQAPRLRCLVHIFLQLSKDQKEFAEAVIPEAILCTRAMNKKARTSAFTLLLAIGQALEKWSPDSDKSAVREQYVCTVMAGLAGSPQMIHATILALSRLVIEYRGAMSLGMIQVLIENACILLKSKSREIAAPSVGLMKILIGSISVEDLSQFLHEVVTSLTTMKDDNKHHLRFKTKSLYERLVRKFGFETIKDMTPASQHKLLVNIKKTQDRAKRREGGKGGSVGLAEDDEEEYFHQPKPAESIDDLLQDSDDSDLEPDADLKPSKAKKTQRGQGPKSKTWLLEKEDSVTDLLDSSMSKNVTGSRPIAVAKRPSQSTKEAFKLSADGRMIITEAAEEESATAPRSGGVKRKAPAKDDLDELFDEIEDGPAKSKRRIPSRRDEGDNKSITWRDSASGMTSTTYRTGGRGIHRNTNAKKSHPPSETGAGFKAKKAGGDVKKGQVDPYAYVPLNAKLLNRRSKAKHKGQFKSFVGSKARKSKAARGGKSR